MDVEIYGFYHYSWCISWCWYIVNVAFGQGRPQQLLLGSATRFGSWNAIVIMAFIQSNDVYYETKLATTAEPLILWYQSRNIKNCQLRALSNECCPDFIGQNIDEISHFSSLRHYLRSSKWHVGRSAGGNSRPIAKLRCPSEPFTQCLNVRDMIKSWMLRFFESVTSLGPFSDAER